MHTMASRRYSILSYIGSVFAVLLLLLNVSSSSAEQWSSDGGTSLLAVQSAAQNVLHGTDERSRAQFSFVADVRAKAMVDSGSFAAKMRSAFQTLKSLGGQAVKPLWPLDARDIAMVGIIAFSLCLAGGAGIGGGAILVPTFILVRQFPTSTSVALSNITVLGGSFANFIWNVSRRRDNGMPLIDWELILMMEPTTIVGAVVGGYLNKLLPVWITTILLTLMLTLMTYRLLTKATQSYRSETALLRELEQQRLLRRGSSTLGHSPRGISKAPGAKSYLEYGESDADAKAPLLRNRDQNPPAGAGSRSLTAPLLENEATGGGEEGGSTYGTSFVGDSTLLRRRSSRAVAAGGFQHPHHQPQLLSESRSFTRGESFSYFQGDVIDVTPPPLVALPSDSDEEEEGVVEVASDPEAPAAAVNLSAPVALGAPPPGPGPSTATGAKTLTTSGLNSARPELKGHHYPLVPFGPLAVLLLLSAWVVASDLGKGHWPCGSWVYWLVTASVVLPVAAAVTGSRNHLLKKYDGVVHLPGALKWTPVTTLLYPTICTAAGLVAGLFGIGGGVVKGPLMLELGVAPDVAAATSATMIMFTAGSACVVYSRFGTVPFDYGVLLLWLGFILTLCGQLLTFTLVKALGRRSVIVFMMGALMAGASLVMFYQSGIVVHEVARHPEELWRIGNFCGGKP